VVSERRVLRTGSRFEAAASFSRALRVGRRILVSATAPLDEKGALVAEGAYEQAAYALAKALAAVAELGGTREAVVRTRLYLAAGAAWEGPVRAHQEAFAGVNPTNTTLYVHGFIPQGVLVEVELEAEL
jgi:enamine deaminase RidA (YjgF/YER057c/UK114 family)